MPNDGRAFFSVDHRLLADANFDTTLAKLPTAVHGGLSSSKTLKTSRAGNAHLWLQGGTVAAVSSKHQNGQLRAAEIERFRPFSFSEERLPVIKMLFVSVTASAQ